MKRVFYALAAALLCAGIARADIKPAALFGDHMVLQQNQNVPVWGTASPGEVVTAAIAGQKRATTTGADGKWMVRLAPLQTGSPLTLTLSGKNTVTISDVLVGEVWLASGQSNMDFTVAKTEKKYFAGVQNEAGEIARANYPQMRMFTVELKMADTPQTDVAGHWAVCSPQTVGDFSAVAYFFGRDLTEKLRVPVGFITSTWGASTAQCWTSRDALAAQPALKPLVESYEETVKRYTPENAQADYEKARKAWEEASAKAKAEGKRAPRAPGKPHDPHQDQHNPYLLYNGMIAPVKPYAIRGAIWYQGESNGPTAREYFTLMKTLIANWRADWKQGDFPFLFVQLANINDLAVQPVASPNGTARVREGQLQTLTIPHTAMAVTIDIGEAKNVHPKNKQEAGRRLALAARATVYGEKVAYSGPLYDKMRVDGSTIRLQFTHADGGLVLRDKGAGFAIAGADGKWVWADTVRVDGDAVVVSAASVPVPTAVRYAWADNPPVSLYNKAGLPASPFRTDAEIPAR